MIKKYSVYILTAPNGKKYVGTTSKKPKYRWDNGNGYHHNNELTKDIKKYGWENFKKEIVAEGIESEVAYELEEKLIKEHKSNVNGYNKSTGGKSSFSGVKMSENQKNKISKSLMNHEVTEETRNKIRIKTIEHYRILGEKKNEIKFGNVETNVENARCFE